MANTPAASSRDSLIPDIDAWFAFVESLSELAYLLGREFAQFGGRKEDVPFFFEPRVVLAWEAGWDDYQEREAN